MIQFLGMKHTPALVIGNWKLNPSTAAEAKTLFGEIKKKLPKILTTKVVVAPPFLFIPVLAALGNKITKQKIALGAQDVFYEERGAITGEIGPGMLASFGVEYIIIGHSERRALGESDVQVNKKVQAVLKRKLIPIVCIGEKVRDSQGQFFNDIAIQLRSLAKDLTEAQLQKVIIAYEPIWAIGTGATATVEDVKEMQLFIVSTLTKLYPRKAAEKIKLLYGGSVKESNAKSLYEEGGMDGFLVGGASLIASEFIAIIKATQKLS
jgi:triosephosphate isomerase